VRFLNFLLSDECPVFKEGGVIPENPDAPLVPGIGETERPVRLSEARNSDGELIDTSTVSTYESDPNGLDQHAVGSKLDAGKPKLGLVLGDFGNALLAVGEVGTFGADKYTAHGWLSVENGEARYTDALYRHLVKEGLGETVDEDSELLHAAHAAWNALAKLELQLRNAKGI